MSQSYRGTNPPPRKFTTDFRKGDEVAIIREEHGWHDGRVSGIIEHITDFSCAVRCNDGGTFSGLTFTIPKPRDIHLIRRNK